MRQSAVKMQTKLFITRFSIIGFLSQEISLLAVFKSYAHFLILNTQSNSGSATKVVAPIILVQFHLISHQQIMITNIIQFLRFLNLMDIN